MRCFIRRTKARNQTEVIMLQLLLLLPPLLLLLLLLFLLILRARKSKSVPPVRCKAASETALRPWSR